jgi:ketosteroid isomerase-like protein
MTLLKRKRAGLGDAMDVVTRFVNACNRHDADGVYACLHPDFDSIQPMYPGRNFRGADQVRRNWQAIFDAEPGFRLTVLRSAATDDTVWLELHGAGQDAEVAGVFVMGIVGDRIRWARIYSALVEPIPAGAEPVAASPGLRQVPPVGDSPAADSGDVVEEALIAPVLDMERSNRRRRRHRSDGTTDGEAEATDEVEATEGAEEAAATDEAENAEPEVDPEATAAVDVVVVESESGGDEEPAVEVITAEEESVVTVDEVVVIEPATEEAEPTPEPVVADDDAGPDTEAVPLIVWDDDPAEDAAPPIEEDADIFGRPADDDDEPDDDTTSKRRFGWRPRP